ncbi:hypothetical protein A2U01_0084200, partial [Trifolium medium]|nr:hypothetical protein [Trifolium medium]
APPRTLISLQRFNSEILSLQLLVGVPESGEHLCYVLVGRRCDRQDLVHRLFLRELWTLSQQPLRDFLNFIFVLLKGGFFSISEITG